MRKLDDIENSVFKYDQFMMSFQVFKSYTVTIMFLYIWRCLGYLAQMTSILEILQTTV